MSWIHRKNKKKCNELALTQREINVMDSYEIQEQMSSISINFDKNVVKSSEIQ